MDREQMDEYIREFLEKYEHYKKDAKIRKELFAEGSEAVYAFRKQCLYEDPASLEENFRNSVKSVGRNKDAAIRVYRLFFEFLKEKGITAVVNFPPVPVSNSFERLMYIAKYFHEDRQISGLSDILWIDSRTVEKDLSKLRGKDDDPLQVCGKVFKIPEVDRKKDKLIFASTAHPLFLTQNLTQVLIMLKGLKAMSEKWAYARYAETAAADIWAQLSDYAKKRIHYVLSELLPDDLSWYEKLEKKDNSLFYTERACSVPNYDVMYCVKNGKTFRAEIRDGEKTRIYSNCRDCGFERTEDHSEAVSFMTDEGRITVPEENIVRFAYIPEELV